MNDHKATPRAHSDLHLRRAPNRHASVSSGEDEAAQPEERPTGDGL